MTAALLGYYCCAFDVRELMDGARTGMQFMGDDLDASVEDYSCPDPVLSTKHPFMAKAMITSEQFV